MHMTLPVNRPVYFYLSNAAGKPAIYRSEVIMNEECIELSDIGI